ncbi:hypothetical protein [Chitinophaga sp. MM2321]|uniref:hypothetical protein n=1 Tax=Chitinophaga sp. MM2321 TaxID=3137178 RepID=UPI0032D59AF9
MNVLTIGKAHFYTSIINPKSYKEPHFFEADGKDITFIHSQQKLFQLIAIIISTFIQVRSIVTDHVLSGGNLVIAAFSNPNWK